MMTHSDLMIYCNTVDWNSLSISIDWNKEVPLNRLLSLRSALRENKRKLESGDVNIYNGKYSDNIRNIGWAIAFLSRKIEVTETNKKWLNKKSMKNWKNYKNLVEKLMGICFGIMERKITLENAHELLMSDLNSVVVTTVRGFPVIRKWLNEE